MATIQRRKNANGTTSYKVMIRTKDGLPPTYKTFPTNQEAKDWALQEEARRRQGIYFPEQIKKKRNLSELIDRYIELILPSKPKNARDTLRQLQWWKQQIGHYALNLVTPDLIAQCRKQLLDGVTLKGTKRTPATVNRYLAALSVICSYGIKECGWLSNNPVLRVSKLAEPRGRDRVLSPEECARLLDACAKSACPYLLPFILLALTTGARRSELQLLTWNCIQTEQGIIHLKQTKNGRPRVLALVGQALELLKMMEQERDPLNPMVFPSKTRFGRLTLRKPWKKALKEANLTDLRLHDLRHFFCTSASESGFSNIELQAASGHLSLSQLQRYCHPNASVVKRLSTAVSEKISKKILDKPHA